MRPRNTEDSVWPCGPRGYPPDHSRGSAGSSPALALEFRDPCRSFLPILNFHKIPTDPIGLSEVINLEMKSNVFQLNRRSYPWLMIPETTYRFSFANSDCARTTRPFLTSISVRKLACPALNSKSSYWRSHPNDHLAKREKIIGVDNNRWHLCLEKLTRIEKC